MRKKIAWLLCFAMIMTMLPINAYAAEGDNLAGLVTAGNKVELELVLVEPANGVTSENQDEDGNQKPADFDAPTFIGNDTGYRIKDATAAPGSLKVGDTFMVAVKLKGLERLNVVGAKDYGLFNMTTSIEYMDEYLEINSSVEGYFSEYVSSLLNAGNGLNNASTLWKKDTARATYKFDDTATKGAEKGNSEDTKIAVFTFGYSKTGTNPTYKGSGDAAEYVAAIYFKV